MEDTMYHRLGGFDAINAMVTKFWAALEESPRLGIYFRGLNNTSKERVRRQIVDYFIDKTGGPIKYSGLDMHAAHAGLRIDAEDWHEAQTILGGMMAHAPLNDTDRAHMGQLVASLKDEIVQA